MPLSHAQITTKLRAAGCVFAEDEASLMMSEAKSETKLGFMIEQRVSGLPLEQILGWAEFCGLRIKVIPGVFVPRRRSELLVGEAAKITRPGTVVLDLCCGTGALGAALHSTVPNIKLYATDIELAAVKCARQNVVGLGGQVFHGDLFNGLPQELRGGINLIIVNAPYVPTTGIQFMPSEARDYEPLVTLDGGTDGHDVQRRVLAEAASWLTPGGKLIMETSTSQASQTAAIARQYGFVSSTVHDPEIEATVVVATKPV